MVKKKLDKLNGFSTRKKAGDTIDGRNPVPVGMENIPYSHTLLMYRSRETV